MSNPSSSHPDRSGGSRRAPDPFYELVHHPSLAGLAGRGPRLDRLPLASTAAALVGCLFVSLLVLGLTGGILVVVMAVLPFVLAGSLLLDGEVHAGRTMLRMIRAVLVGWAVATVLVVPPPSLERPSPRTASTAAEGRSAGQGYSVAPVHVPMVGGRPAPGSVTAR